MSISKGKIITILLIVVFVAALCIILFSPQRKHDKDYIPKRRIEVTKTKMKLLKSTLISFYKEQNKQFPNDIQTLLANQDFIEFVREKEIKKERFIYDEWDERFIYRRDENNQVVLKSKGPDKIKNTSDDITFILN